jgi:hypothetical protein
MEWVEKGWLTSAQGNERERLWIKRMRERGCNLTNHTDGGDGGYGLEHSEATRAKIGIAVREDWKKNTESRSQAMRKSWANDEERRQRASEQMKALWASGRMTPSRKRR